jgi:DNA-binding CsgD family transcriptional regulator
LSFRNGLHPKSKFHAGGQCFPASLGRRLAERGLHKRLTPREVETLDLLRRGLSNDDIGTALGVSKSTVKKHVAAILLKLEVADRAEAVAAGFESGLLHIESRHGRPAPALGSVSQRGNDGGHSAHSAMRRILR